MTDSQLMKQTRNSLGLNQRQMAERLGYAHSKEISYIENGKREMSNQVRQHLLTIREYEI